MGDTLPLRREKKLMSLEHAAGFRSATYVGSGAAAEEEELDEEGVPGKQEASLLVPMVI